MREDAVPDIAHGEVSELEDLVDKESLRDVCRSFFELFKLPIRILSNRGMLLARAYSEHPLCAYVNTAAQGRVACSATVAKAQALVPPGTAAVPHPCFTGATYQVIPIVYDDRQLGRVILGPYRPAEPLKAGGRHLPVLAADLDPSRVHSALAEMPRVHDATAERIAAHLRATLDLILFAGHRAHLTSAMHLATVKENYRELSQKNASLQEAFNKLQELDRLKSNFLATVSHELRTPLTSIIGYSEMLSDGVVGELSPEQGGFVQTIRNKGELLLSLITSLLDLNKLERGQVRLELTDVNPVAVLEEIKNTFVPAAERKGLTLLTSCEPMLPPLKADPVRLRQVLINLAGNAVKFTHGGGQVSLGARLVEVASEDEDPEDRAFGAALMMAPERAIEFWVRDTGVGMAEPELKRIFDAFYQVDGSSTREFGGAGLGLSIAKNLVDAHRGTIRVESTPGKGSTFYVTLPLHPDEH